MLALDRTDCVRSDVEDFDKLLPSSWMYGESSGVVIVDIVNVMPFDSEVPSSAGEEDDSGIIVCGTGKEAAAESTGGVCEPICGIVVVFPAG